MDKSEAELAAVFRRRLRAARESKRWTQAELANSANVSVVTVSKLEQGVNLPTFVILMALCRALEVSPNELVDWADRSNEPRRILSAAELRITTALNQLRPVHAQAIVEMAEKLAAGETRSERT